MVKGWVQSYKMAGNSAWDLNTKPPNPHLSTVSSLASTRAGTEHQTDRASIEHEIVLHSRLFCRYCYYERPRSSGWGSVCRRNRAPTPRRRFPIYWMNGKHMTIDTTKIRRRLMSHRSGCSSYEGEWIESVQQLLKRIIYAKPRVPKFRLFFLPEIAEKFPLI